MPSSVDSSTKRLLEIGRSWRHTSAICGKCHVDIASAGVGLKVRSRYENLGEVWGVPIGFMMKWQALAHLLGTFKTARCGSGPQVCIKA